MGSGQDIRGKVSMKKLFGRRNIKKDGTEGKVGRRLNLQEPKPVCGFAPCRGPNQTPSPTHSVATPITLLRLQLLVLPPVEELQRGSDSRWRWVLYSAYDAKATWDLHAALARELRRMPASLDPAVREDLRQVTTGGGGDPREPSGVLG
jgi:hypothetical protein